MANGEHPMKKLSGTGCLWEVEKMYMRTQDVGSWKHKEQMQMLTECKSWCALIEE